ncbi:head-tail adaptor protein [Anatilimnocola floriformis]|uniref:head-tail adaptor protein n=1 Tax=Anatilimnocola floriformis TaxID=2948575 RepID=UPI0020C4BBA8|nr:head-tail adaptor protein [Anatilimnocola floriformis]
MRSGQLRHRIFIQTPPDGPADARGFKTGEWETLYNLVPSSVVDLQGLELIRAQKVVAEATVQIEIRFHAGIDTTCRAKFGNRFFQLLHVNNVDQRNIKQVILAKEIR